MFKLTICFGLVAWAAGNRLHNFTAADFTAVVGGGTSALVDKTAAKGGPASWNNLQEDPTINDGNPTKHQPYLQFHQDRTVTLSVRGGAGAITADEPGQAAPSGGLHSMSWNADNLHVIERIFLVDQDGNVHCDHEFDDTEASPEWKCDTPLPPNVTSATPVEYCNLHGTWTGPTFNVGWEVDAASYRAKVNQSDTISPTYLHAELSDTGSKHEPFADLGAAPASVVVRGGEGSVTALHAQNYGSHWIETIYARDQHDRVVGSSSLPDADTGPATPSITMELSAVSPPVTKLTPFEFCNLHGLWFGRSTDCSAPPPEPEDPFVTNSCPADPEPTSSASAAAAAAAVLVVSVLAAAL